MGTTTNRKVVSCRRSASIKAPSSPPDSKRYKDVIGILCSDLHLSHDVPVFRSAEPDWYVAMARPLKEIQLLAGEYQVPIICAGDVFHHWKQPPQLISFAIEQLHNYYAIPGNHDLPNHDYASIEKSAYCTLSKAGTIMNIVPSFPLILPNITLHGFPYGFEVAPCSQPPHTFGVNLAIVHAYIWLDGYSHPDVTKDSHVKAFKAKLKGYDAAHFGDNHSAFSDGIIYKELTMPLINTGCLMRRRADEKTYLPRVGILHRWGLITEHFLDISKDKFFAPEYLHGLKAESPGLQRLLRELGDLGPTSCDFEARMKEALDSGKVSSTVRARILTAMETK